MIGAQQNGMGFYDLLSLDAPDSLVCEKASGVPTKLQKSFDAFCSIFRSIIDIYKTIVMWRTQGSLIILHKTLMNDNNW